MYKTPFTLYKKEQTTERGRVVTTYTEAGMFKGQYDPNDGDYLVVSDKKEWLSIDDFFCPITVPIKHGDRISIRGVEYNVLSVMDTYDYHHHLECKIEKVV